jgi:type I restriction enzyme M protein
VECKSETEKTGRKQLEIYLTLSDAFIGVWFNGKSHLYINKYYENGKVFFKDLPTLPRFGQRVEDIGLYSAARSRAMLKCTGSPSPAFWSRKACPVAGALTCG